MTPSGPLDRLGRGLGNPLVQAVVFYALFLATALAGRAIGQKGIPLLAGAAFMTLFSIANPVSLVFARRFWPGLLLSLVVWLALFVAISATIEARGRMGDDGMVFLGAFTIYPVALVAAGVVRLVRRRARFAP